MRLQQEGRSREVTALFARRMKYNFAATFVAMLLGGVIAQFYLPAGWALFTVLSLAGVFVGLQLKESSAVERTGSARPQSAGRHLLSGLRTIRDSTALAATLLLLLIGNIAYEGVDQFWQIYAEESRGIAVLWFGAATGIAALILFFSAGPVTRWLEERLGYKNGISLLVLAAAVFLTLFALLGGVVAVLGCFVLFSVLRNLQEPLITGYVSDHSPSQTRATVLSTNNLICSAGEMIAALGLGWLAGAVGLQPLFLVAAVLLVGGGALFYRVFGRRRETGLI